MNLFSRLGTSTLNKHVLQHVHGIMITRSVLDEERHNERGNEAYLAIKFRGMSPGGCRQDFTALSGYFRVDLFNSIPLYGTNAE